MTLRHLTDSDRTVVAECLRAVVEGPFFPDGEFQLLMGLEREQMAEILKKWPDVEEDDQHVALGVHNVLGNLIGYPHGLHDRWRPWISYSSARLEETFERWLRPKPPH